MTKAYIVKILGRVTGVGFRYSTVNRVATLPSIRGYVRNVAYDQVEALIQGEDSELRQLMDWFREGPSYARVDTIKANEVPVNPKWLDFEVR